MVPAALMALGHDPNLQRESHRGPLKPSLNHPNIRGAEYFDSGEPPALQ
jgi:hypothetical protein